MYFIFSGIQTLMAPLYPKHCKPSCTHTVPAATVMVFLPQPLAQIFPLHLRWFHPLQLAPVVFFLPPTGADTRHTLGQYYTTYITLHYYGILQLALYILHDITMYTATNTSICIRICSYMLYLACCLAV